MAVEHGETRPGAWTPRRVERRGTSCPLGRADGPAAVKPLRLFPVRRCLKAQAVACKGVVLTHTTGMKSFGLVSR